MQVWVRNFALRDGSIQNPNKLTGPEFIIQQLKNITGNNDTNYNIEQFLIAVVKYAELHYDLFGTYKGSLMQEPSESVMEKISGTFEEYLDRNGLKVLVPLLERTNSAQGYGYVSEIGAIYGLMWNTPQLLLSYGLQTLQIQQPPYQNYIFTKGWENIWNKIVEKERFDIKYNVDISQVLRHNDNRVTLTYVKQYQRQDTENCDFLVWTPPMTKLIEVLSNPTTEERELFSPLSHHVFVASIIKDTGTIRNRPTLVYHQSLQDGQRNITDGGVIDEIDTEGEINYCDRNDDGHLPRNCWKTNEEYDQRRTPRVLSTFQLRRNKIDKAISQDIIRKHYMEGFGATDVQFIHTKEWEYFYKWSPEELVKGYHWKVFNIQGRHGIWYAGASVSFESVKDVMEYNNLLIRQSEKEGRLYFFHLIYFIIHIHTLFNSDYIC